ncbi:MAG: DUF4838 domain-containing protein, partial [Bacteroidota bacterium]
MSDTEQNYNVQMNSARSELLNNSINDVRALLRKCTGGKTIPVLKLSKKPFDARTVLKDPQAFELRSNKDSILIYGISDLALVHGMYYYLEQVGFRFFMPGERWTHIPVSDALNIEITTTTQPSFVNRVLFSQGGFMLNPVDPKNQKKKDWELWKQRNRTGQLFKLGGHSWHEFNLKYKDLLVRNPEYLAMVDGKRVSWYPNAKFNIGNPIIRKLYVQERIEAYEKLLDKYGPNDFRSWGICVDPSDGVGHCESPESLALGTVSDRVFLLANEVAIALRKKYPNAWVYLYAYNMHAAVPKIKLEPNVYVQVVPYAFQREAAPEVLLNEWAQKTKQLGIYDYINLPDAHLDQPVHDWKEIGTKINHWKNIGVESVLFETTNALGPAGLANYLAARMMWDHDLNESELIQEFFDLNFGNASAEMKTMLSRWANQYGKQFETPLALDNLNSASKLETNGVKAERINQYKSYVQYLKLLHEAGYNNQSNLAKANQLMNYMWSSYDSYMVHTSWVQHLLLTKWNNSSLKSNWNLKSGLNGTWRKVRPETITEIENQFKQNLQANNKSFHISSISTPLQTSMRDR